MDMDMVMEMEMEMGRARGANERPENYFKLTVAIASRPPTAFPLPRPAQIASPCRITSHRSASQRAASPRHFPPSLSHSPPVTLPPAFRHSALSPSTPRPTASMHFVPTLLVAKYIISRTTAATATAATSFSSPPPRRRRRRRLLYRHTLQPQFVSPPPPPASSSSLPRSVVLLSITDPTDRPTDRPTDLPQSETRYSRRVASRRYDERTNRSCRIAASRPFGNAIGIRHRIGSPSPSPSPS
ncbi:hypothetical protein V9T40_010496 [Parthenolecanium corni]|uniref:Uncharacterized protein n=1 Tax=Parthenolecanium corni TaxID=536013 RepID=A0AAN9T695_9HEMI